MNLSPKIIFYYTFFTTFILNLGCTKLWLSPPELGSKTRPIEFYMINNLDTADYDNSSESNLQKCIEEKTGYRINFNYVSDEKAVISELVKGNAQYGIMSSIAYVGASSRSALKSILIFSERGIPSTRSVIIGKSIIWKKYFQKLGLTINSYSLNSEAILPYFNKATVAYSTPDDPTGFLVPRMYFLQRNIFPDKAIFVGNYSSVLQAIDENLASIGVVSESYINIKYPNFLPIQLATQFDNYIVLGLSQSLLGNVLVESKRNLNSATHAITNGIEQCSQIRMQDFKKLFNADGVQSSNEKLFSFTKELYEFQQENIRILTQRNP